jgi:hypothetical protein
LEDDSRAASRIERASRCRAPILAVAWKRRGRWRCASRPPSLSMLKSEDNRPGAPSGHLAKCWFGAVLTCKTQCADKHLASPASRERQFALSCRRAVEFPLLPCLTAKHANSCEIARNAVIPIMARYAALTWVRRDRQQVADSE